MAVTERSPFLVVSPWRTLGSPCSTSRRSLLPPGLDVAPGWGSRVREGLTEVTLIVFLLVCVPRVLDGPDEGDARASAAVWLCLVAASVLVLLDTLLGFVGFGFVGFGAVS